jgi:hypothetical protein
MDWTPQQEEFLRRLHLECHTLAEYNRKQFQVYSRIHQRFTVPILVLSGINSLFAVSTQPFLEQNLISITNACLSLFCGILGSIQMFMKVDSKIHQFVICAHEFKKLSYRISRELSVEPNVRSNNAKEFLNDAFNEFNNILDKMETKEKRTREWLMLPETNEGPSDSTTMSTESMDPCLPVMVGDADVAAQSETSQV